MGEPIDPELNAELHAPGGENWSPLAMPVIRCPHCDAPNNAWTSTDGNGVERPVPGALSLCFVCGGLCVYTDSTHMRKATDTEEAEWSIDPTVMRTRKVLGYTDSPQLASTLLLMER